MDWELKQALRDQLGREQGYFSYPSGTRSRMALVYPNSYFVGMSNLGLHIIYALMNQRDDTACERVFLPERRERIRYEKTRTPIMSMEHQLPLYEFPLIAFVLSFEMDYFHVLRMLELGRVCLRSRERGERDPLVIAGGPCATFNPEPLAEVVDAFIIGEGEVIMPAFMDVYYEARRKGLARRELLQRLAQVPGVYVPSFYAHRYDEQGRLTAIEPEPGIPSRVSRQWVRDLDAYPAHTVVLTDHTEFNFYLIETARGCGRHCRFCMAGYCFRKPRNRSLGRITQQVREALPYGKRIGLMGAAISDYPEINALCRDILGEGLSMSVASFRADSVTADLVQSLADSGLKTLTMAPEAGSPKMRAVINKGIEEKHLFHAMEMGLAAGIRHFRLYLMVGLPFEQEEDIDAIIDLASRLKDYMEEKGSKGTLTLSVNPFIPKPFTPFQWKPMADRRYVEKAFRKLSQAFHKRKHILVNTESVKEAYIQGVIARGDRRVGEAILKAHELGGAKAFKRVLRECGLQAEDYLYRDREKDEVFPWACLDMGVRSDYLYDELLRAQQQQATIPCFDGCHRCGVC